MYFNERVEFYSAGGGVTRSATGGFTTYPGVEILDRLRRGAAVELQGFYLVAGAKRAGIARPAVNPSTRYRVARDGTFSEVTR